MREEGLFMSFPVSTFKALGIFDLEARALSAQNAFHKLDE
ncbi:hypothetical protein CEV31_4105 [Brucella thiophenivorans]|uniref:Uncharacterized protein n=1 Tax=Brucella thiophenivorans TaxID=571255 RepID=A0A256EZV8_9HYPH|nr:hypothetical protein CEV31_4105 [Brucella thiophenivorans]